MAKTFQGLMDRLPGRKRAGQASNRPATDPKAAAEASAKIAESYKDAAVSEEESDKSFFSDDYAFFADWLKAAADPDERLRVGEMFADVRTQARKMKQERRDRRDYVFLAAGAVAMVAAVGATAVGVEIIKGKLKG